MSIKKILKGSLLCLLALGTLSSLNINNVNARRHHHTRRITVVHKHKRNTRRHFKYRKSKSHHRKLVYTFNKRHNKRFHHKIRKNSTKRRRKLSLKPTRASRKHRTRRNKVRHNYMYLLDTESDYGQLMDNDSFKDLKAENGGNVCATSADDGELVHIIGKASVDGKVFYRIKDRKDPIDTGWIYSGDLSYNPNGKAHPIDTDAFPINDSDTNSNTSSNNVPRSTSTTSSVKTPNMNRTLSKMQSQIINDINTARQNNGVASLTESPQLDQIANMRAKQAQSVYGHDDPATGEGYADEDSTKIGYSNTFENQTRGENLDEVNLGTTPSQDGQVNYYNRNGADLAHDTTDNMLHHDASNNWGHRDNILSPDYTSIGVGVNYQKGQEWPIKVAEIFQS